jgi:hypothetical protein
MTTTITYNMEEFLKRFSHHRDVENIVWDKAHKYDIETQLNTSFGGFWTYNPMKEIVTHSFMSYDE